MGTNFIVKNNGVLSPLPLSKHFFLFLVIGWDLLILFFTSGLPGSCGAWSPGGISTYFSGFPLFAAHSLNSLAIFVTETFPRLLESFF